MRIIVYGVGAVGGVVAGSLARAGHDCIGIARGARLDAIREKGLNLRSQTGSERVALTCVSGPAEIDWRPDDAIMLVVKGQHTAAALEDLRAAGVRDQPIFCTQNGVENERVALRIFPNVHGVNVMLPAEYVALDEAVGFGSPNFGIFEIGAYPGGVTREDEALAEALTDSGIAGFAMPDVMTSKYGKLILNLGNIVEAALSRAVGGDDIAEALKAEGRAVLDGAGIAWRDVGPSDPRREMMKIGTVEGAARVGGSSTQSLERGAGSIETDYLNGEIALIGRLNGIPAPLNAAVAQFAAGLASERRKPGSVTREEMIGVLGLSL